MKLIKSKFFIFILTVLILGPFPFSQDHHNPHKTGHEIHWDIQVNTDQIIGVK